MRSGLLGNLSSGHLALPSCLCLWGKPGGRALLLQRGWWRGGVPGGKAQFPSISGRELNKRQPSSAPQLNLVTVRGCNSQRLVANFARLSISAQQMMIKHTHISDGGMIFKRLGLLAGVTPDAFPFFIRRFSSNGALVRPFGPVNTGGR